MYKSTIKDIINGMHKVTSHIIIIMILRCACQLYSETSGGRWETSGVTSNYVNGEDTINCYSSHLTSFAVLVDVVEPYDDDASDNSTDTTDIEEEILSVVSYIGCSVSIVCLVVAIVLILTLR